MAKRQFNLRGIFSPIFSAELALLGYGLLPPPPHDIASSPRVFSLAYVLAGAAEVCYDKNSRGRQW